MIFLDDSLNIRLENDDNFHSRCEDNVVSEELAPLGMSPKYMCQLRSLF